MKFNELYERLLESQQLELDFNAPPKPERVYAKWMVSCASKKITTAALYKMYENIKNMTHTHRRTVAFNCFMYAIKRRLKSLGFKTPHALEEQGIPLYIAASEKDYINVFFDKKIKRYRSRCREIKWR